MVFKFKKTLLAIGMVLVIFLAFQAGVETGKTLVVCPVCQPQEIDFSLFWETHQILREKFVDKDKIDIQKIIYGAISGMTKALEDPYTVFLTPKETEKFEQDLTGIFEGVGMEIGIKNNELTVIAPLEGTPAKEAGLRSGDKILKINETETFDITVEKAVSLIRGQKGTEVTLTIFRKDWKRPKEIKIIRGIIKIPSLKWELKEQDIVYLRLYQFYQPLSSDFRKAAVEILSSPGKKIILDLRNNPGGYLEVAQDITEWFLKKGDIIVIEDFGENNKTEYRSNKNGEFSNYPIVVLVNEGSASASEILAGALRDNREALIIGEKSFGKGSIQEQISLREGSSIKITIAKWLTPLGVSISDVGIEPDIKVEITEEDYEQDKDPQLDKAIEVIKNL